MVEILNWIDSHLRIKAALAECARPELTCYFYIPRPKITSVLIDVCFKECFVFYVFFPSPNRYFDFADSVLVFVFLVLNLFLIIYNLSCIGRGLFGFLLVLFLLSFRQVLFHLQLTNLELCVQEMINITKHEKDSNRLAYHPVTKRFMVSAPRVIMHVQVSEQEKYKNSEISIIRLVTNKLSLKEKKSNCVIFVPKIDHHVSREFLTIREITTSPLFGDDCSLMARSELAASRKPLSSLE